MANNNSNGVSGSNVITGGSGNDKLNGGASSDTLNGGAGSDSLNGDSSNDSLIYGLAENGGATYIYTGGSGIDTVRVNLTQAEWMNAAVEYQLARYYQHLPGYQRAKRLACPSPKPPEQIASDPSLARLREFREER